MQALLTERMKADPYGESFTKELAALPVGLRAMAPTHWLDISLTLDSITWHFGNFGDPGLVAATEAGLIELGLVELAAVFVQARDLITPEIVQTWKQSDNDLEEVLKARGLAEQADALDERGWALGNTPSGESLIYEAWVRYARAHPERVFSDQ